MPLKRLSIYTDGASRNNPGEAGIGVVMKDDRGETIQTLAEYIGVATNNVAEYTAVIRALEWAQKLHPERIDCYLDSQLVVRQMTGKYKIKHPGMIPLAKEVRRLCRLFPEGSVDFHHIPREENQEADALANEAIDKRSKKV
ncbi:MAG: ribonuclease HI family protein [Candidatus Manganitrophaceae bacterium]